MNQPFKRPDGAGLVPPAQPPDDEHDAQLRQVEQELEEEEKRGEEPEPSAGAGVRSGVLTIAAIVVFAGILAGVGGLCGQKPGWAPSSAASLGISSASPCRTWGSFRVDRRPIMRGTMGSPSSR